MDGISYAQMRIMGIIQCFKRLAGVYEDMGDGDSAAALEYKEMADILENIAQPPDREYDREIIRTAAKLGVDIQGIDVQNRKDGCYAEIMASTKKRGAVKAAELARLLGDILGAEFEPEYGGRSLITTNPANFTFWPASRYITSMGVSCIGKESDVISGDSYTYIPNSCGRMCAGIFDGMGTGLRAGQKSGRAIDVFERFFEAGFSAAAALRLLNSNLVKAGGDETLAADCTVLDLRTGVGHCAKYGGVATYIKRPDEIEIISPSSMPAGVLEEAFMDTADFAVGDEAYIIMVSDGTMDALPFYDKEQRMANIIDGINVRNPELFAKKLMDEVRFFVTDGQKDDMTVLVTGIWKKNGLT